MKSVKRFGVISLLLISGGALALEPQLDAAYDQVMAEGERNRVLNQMRAGTMALDLGHVDLATRSFDEALVRINTIYADDETAKKARSLWYSEGTKTFIGEPYERAMVHYYRGLIDMMAGEYDNARASFKGGVLQDAFAEEEQNRADFAILMFLSGWASHLRGETAMAKEAWEEVQTFRPDFVFPAADHNLLVVAESGKAPRKLADGVGHNLLVYRRGKRFKERSVKLVAGAPVASLYPMEDIFVQAATRGGRPVDAILDGQVKFKKGAAKFGSVLTDTASAAADWTAYATGANTSTGVFGAMQVAGALALAFSSGARAEADTRYWDNLPDAVHIMTGKVSDFEGQLQFEYLNHRGASLKQPMLRQAPVQVDKNGNGLVWVRSRPATELK